MFATLTLMGLNNYLLGMNLPDLFAEAEIPEGIDADTLKNIIIQDAGEFEVLYSNPDYLRTRIKLWFDKWRYTFDKWVMLSEKEFEPLHNFDRHEEYEDETNLGHTITNTVDMMQTLTKGSAESTLVAPSTSNIVNDANDSSFKPKERVRGSGSDTTGDAGTNTEQATGTDKVKHTGHLYGNIGVTESTAMGEHFKDYVKNINVYHNIADMFIQEFCLMVY